MYYMKCLSACDDVREKNRAAFELFKLGDGAELEPAQENEQDDEENEFSQYPANDE